MKRQGLPISSHTKNKPRPTNARAVNPKAKGGESGNEAMAIISINALPVPPNIKLPAARQSQQLCNTL
jgi:hypothetical protein